MAAALTFKNGDLVTTGTTDLTFLTCSDDSSAKITWNEARAITYNILVVSGTPKFGIGGVASSTAYANPASAGVFSIKCRNGNLAVIQSANGDTYRITTS